MGETAIPAESVATEYLRLFDEGWQPDLDEFLSRVPAELRDDCRRRIEELAALNGLDIHGTGAVEPPDDLGALAQEIAPPEGDDAAVEETPSQVRRPRSVYDELSAVVEQESKKKSKRGRRKREPEPEPEPEAADVHVGIEELAAQEGGLDELAAQPELEEPAAEPPAMEEFELGAEPEQPETAYEEPEVAAEPVMPEPISMRSRGGRDEPRYAVPGLTPVEEPPVAAAPPRVKAQRAPASPIPATMGDETLRMLLSQLREVGRLERGGAIPGVESDRLHVIYRRLLDHQGATDDLPISILHLTLYALLATAVTGAWLFVACAQDASQIMQALVPGAVAATFLFAGLRARLRGDATGGSLLFAASSVAAVPAVIAGLAAANMFGGSSALPAPFTEMRLLAGAVTGFGLSTLGLLALRRGLLAWTTAFLAAAAYGAFVLTLGVADLQPHELALRFLPLVALTIPGLVLESQGKVRWAMPFHWVALTALLGTVDTMALRGGVMELAGLHGVIGEARMPYFGVAAAGALMIVLSLAIAWARSFDLRRASRFLQLLGALHLVGALGANIMAGNREARDLAALGGAGALLLVLGSFRRRGSLLLTGGAAVMAALCAAALGGAAPATPYTLTLAGAGLLGGIGLHAYLSRGGT